ncbi:MAG: protein TolR [Desulfobulbaceae bacterium]|nr:MAG: protein TolR [Desulfobulbaceae bacterium]
MGPLNGKGRLVADINVTPLVDVMLVLLIIFMVTAPMMTQGLDVNLPETTSKALRQDDEPLIVTIDKEAKITLGKMEVSQGILKDQLGKMDEERKKEPIYLKADKDVAYGIVVAVMADIKSAGFEKLGMITKPSEKLE